MTELTTLMCWSHRPLKLRRLWLAWSISASVYYVQYKATTFLCFTIFASD